MPMHKFTQRQVQLLSYLEGGYLRQTMEVPTAQEKSEQLFFTQPKAHLNKIADLNKTVLTNPLKMITFLKQCQATNKAAGVHEKIAKDKKQPKEKKMAHLPVARSRESSYHQHCSRKYCNYHRSNQRNRNDCLSDCLDATIALNAMTRTQRAQSPTTRRMIASTITPRKRATRPCTMTSPLCQAWAICLEEGIVLVQDLFRTLVLDPILAQAAGAMTTTMGPKMTAGQIHPSSAGTRTPLRVTMADAFIALIRAIPFLPPSPPQLQRRVSAPRNRKLRQ
jgi:hypothetical protein